MYDLAGNPIEFNFLLVFSLMAARLGFETHSLLLSYFSRFLRRVKH